MAEATLSTINSILKVRYPDKALPYEALYRESPTWAILKKVSDWDGSFMQVPIQFGGRATASPTFAVAVNANSPNLYRNFNVPRVRNFIAGEISREAMLAAEKKSEGAFVDALEREIKGAMYGIGRAITANLFGDSGFALGRLSATAAIATPTITLADPRAIVNFEVGMQLEASAANGNSGSVRAGFVTITAVNAGDVISGSAATITVSGNWDAGITGLAVNDFLFSRGSFGQGFAGFSAWNPVVAPTAGDNFFGVDRSVSVNRLSGSRVSAAGLNIEEAIMYGATQLRTEGGRASHAVMHPLRYQQLLNSQVSKTFVPVFGTVPKSDRGDKDKTIDVGYSGITISAGGMKLTCIDDPQMPVNLVRLFNDEDVEFCSLGPTPHLFDDDGTIILRNPTTDGYSFRGGFYGNLVCYNTINLCVVSLL